VHSYFDLYVAAVINTYRKTYLMLIDVLVRLLPRAVPELNASTALDDPNLDIDQVASAAGAATNTIATWTEKATGLVHEILASIPYHLAKDLSAVGTMSPSAPGGLRTSSTSTSAPGVGRPVGGLLLLHPLYVLSSCTIVPTSVQAYVLKCLAWIGEHMGIGQATVMSKVCMHLKTCIIQSPAIHY
jgi:hypothetical protein